MKKIALAVVVLGVLFHVYIAFMEAEGGPSVFSIGLMLCSWIAYLVSALLAFRIRRAIIPLCGAVLPLVSDVICYDSVFLHPSSSTAAITLLIMPIWNLLAALPLGLVVGWIISLVYVAITGQRTTSTEG